MLLLYFFKSGDVRCDVFEKNAFAAPSVQSKTTRFVCVKLPVDTILNIDGVEMPLLAHGAFRDMQQQPGVVIVDYANESPELFEKVVSAFPITERLTYSPEKVAVMLDLPAGTLTQRTLIYAVRVHPDHPESTLGIADGYLFSEAAQQAAYQAKIELQGHHFWEARFERIYQTLPESPPCEVCAESWPGETLVEAAIECVRCWRLSEGHWNAVRSYHRRYGYDIKRGPNGIWYATGIFGG